MGVTSYLCVAIVRHSTEMAWAAEIGLISGAPYWIGGDSVINREFRNFRLQKERLPASGLGQAWTELESEN
jgi:hypothetical protein